MQNALINDKIRNIEVCNVAVTREVMLFLSSLKHNVSMLAVAS